MEKENPQQWSSPLPPHTEGKPQRRLNLCTHLLVLASLLIFILYVLPIIDIGYFATTGPINYNTPAAIMYGGGDRFTWDSIEAKTELDFVPCFYERDIRFECAKLDVPMDWNAPKDTRGQRVSLAVIRLPVSVPVTDSSYSGSILINPGGPGGSGVNAAMRFGPNLTTIINNKEKAFDIVSWDPRGVNNTTPRLDCFPDVLSADVWRLAGEVEGIGESAVGSLWARARALGGACSDDKDGEGMMGHMNTRAVVGDIVAIIEALGEWREKRGKDILSCPRRAAAMSQEEKVEAMERLAWEKGTEKLNFWGFSYGTLLGATFAAMEPTRVSRLILDGVVDSTDYYKNLWEKDLQNTDGIIDNFYTYCAEAGPERCALNRGNSTAKSIKEALEGLVDGLKEDPKPVWGPEGPEIITYSDVMNLIREALYKPLALFPGMAGLLADVAYGNGTEFAKIKKEGHQPSCPVACDGKGEKQCEKETDREGAMGILCSDGPDVSGRGKEWFREGRRRLLGQSRWLGEGWASIPLGCVSWKGRAKWKVGPEDIKGNTSHPILWIGNSLDPVTPLANAHTMALRFPGSVVLQQNSEGHCCVSSPSLCTAKHVRKYFHTGELPPVGTVCEVNEKPLLGSVEERLYSIEEVEVLEAMRGLGDLGVRRGGPLSPF